MGDEKEWKRVCKLREEEEGEDEEEEDEDWDDDDDDEEDEDDEEELKVFETPFCDGSGAHRG